MRYAKATIIILILVLFLMALSEAISGSQDASLQEPGQIVTDVATPDPTLLALPSPIHAAKKATVPKKRSAPKARVEIVSRWKVPANTYFGPGYNPKYEVTRQCIVKRESEGDYSAHNASGASGGYQFMPDWTRTIQHWTKEYVPIYRMSRQAQDKAWWLAWDNGRNAHHWAGGRWHCPYT